MISVETTIGERRVAAMVVCGIVVCGIAIAPFANVAGPREPSLIAAVTAGAIVAFALTANLILAQYSATGSVTEGVLCIAYASSALLLTIFFATFPGIFAATGLFGAGTQTPVYLYVGWHILFSLLIALASVAERVRCTPRVLLATTAFLAVSIVALIAILSVSCRGLPALTSADRITPYFALIGAPLEIAASVLAIASLSVTARLRTSAYLWLAVIQFVLLAEAVTSVYVSSGRFTYGWYLGRAEFACASVLFLMLLQRRYTQVLRRLDCDNADLNRRNAQVEALIELQRGIAAALPSREAVIDLILSFAQTHTHASGAVMETVSATEIIHEAATGTLAWSVGARFTRAGSLCGQSIDLERNLRCDDTWSDPRVDRRSCEQLDIRSMVVVPVRVMPGRAAVLKIASPRTSAFDAGDMQTLELIASHLQSGLRTAAECESLAVAEFEQRSYAEHLESLHVIASTTTSGRCERIDAALALGLEQLGLDWAFLASVDHASNEFILENSVSLCGRLVLPAGTRIGRAATLLDRVLDSRDLFAVENVDKLTYELTYSGWKSLVSVPIYVGDNVYGAIGFTGEAPRRAAFSAANRTFVKVAGDLVASAIERGLQSERLDSLAFFDALTQLPNRVLLQDRVVQTILASKRRQERFAVMFIDLDGFKLINDGFGHATGDEVLRLTASRLSSLMRESDTVARIGGDEFVVLAPHIDSPSVAHTLALRIIDALSHPLVIDGHSQCVGASIGVSLYPADGADSQTLIARADTAMYMAKALGKGRVEFADASVLAHA